MTRRQKLDDAAAGVLLASGIGVREVAKRFGVTPEAIYNARKAGRLKYTAEDVARVAAEAQLETVEIEVQGETVTTTVTPEDHRDAIWAELYEAAQPVKWTPENVVEVILDYAREYGRAPRMIDWMPYQARRRGENEAAERFERDQCWPLANSVVGPRKPFATWHQALNAAGFTQDA